MRSALTLLPLLMAAIASSGCAAVPLAAVAVSALGGGTNAAVRAGTEYASNGVVYRTFSLPLDELRLRVSETLARMEIAVIRDEVDNGERRIQARARDRDVELRLEPITRTVTRLRLVVSEGRFRKDSATASEIVAQTELHLKERGTATSLNLP